MIRKKLLKCAMCRTGKVHNILAYIKNSDPDRPENADSLNVMRLLLKIYRQEITFQKNL